MTTLTHPFLLNKKVHYFLWLTNGCRHFVIAVLLALCFVQNCAAENTQGSEEWHYTLRPGDTLLAISQALLNHQYTMSDVVRHNHIDNQSILAPGSIIKIPLQWLKQQPQPAKIKTVAGSVQLKRAGQSRYEQLKPGMQIRVGDEIVTRQGSVVIELADGSIISLDEQSNLIFNRLSHFGKTGMVDTQLRLNKGSLTTDIPPLVKGSRYEIKTPSAVAAVRGTEFRLRSDDQGTRVEVLQGVVEFTGEHGQVLVNAGQGASISSNTPRIDLIKLPDAPNTQLAQEKITNLPAKVEWDKVQNAQAYQVRLTEKDKHGQLVQQGRQTDNALELKQIKNGNYELSVSSIDNNGYQGLDANSRIIVDIKGIQAELKSPDNDSIVTESTPAFVWSYTAANDKGGFDNTPQSKVEVALDEDFTAIVTDNDFIKTNRMTLEDPLIPGRYFWRVASLTNNTELSYSDAKSFVIKGQLASIQISSVNYLDKQVGLFWSPVANAEGYLLQVSDSSDFKNILKEEKLAKPRAHLLLNVGKLYFARVKGIANDLYVSEFGPIQEIFIQPK
jgi:hypothetical protein